MESLRAILADGSYLRRLGTLKRLCESIPAEGYAAAYAEISKSDVAKSELLPIFFASWREKNPAAAVAAAEPLLTSKDAGIFRRAVTFWADRDWAAAKAFALHLPANEQKAVTAMLDRRDPSRPAAASNSAPASTADPKGTAAGEGGVAPSPTAEQARERFWKNVKLTPGSLSTQQPLEPLLRDWVLADPQGAAKEILASPALRNYSDVLRVVFEAWKTKDAAAATEFLGGLSFDERRRTVSKIAEDMADKDVAMARATADLVTEPKERAYILSRVAVRVAKKDPGSIPEWVRQIAVADQTFVPMSLFAEWFQHEPALASKTLLEHAGYQDFRQRFPNDPLVSNYVDLLPFAQKDPGAAAQFVSVLSAKDQPESLYRLAKKWAKVDSNAALQWVGSLPEGQVRVEAARQFTFSVAELNASQASKHLESLPTGAVKSAGIEGFAFAAFDVDPDAVLKWTRLIPDPDQRMSVLARAWADWNRKNPRGAKDWAQNVAPLQPEERAALQEKGAL